MAASEAIATVLPGSSDVELADRHRYGDEAAFEEVHERFAPMVYGLCLRMSGDATRAQDLSQDVFLRIFRSLGKFGGRSTLSTWIYTVTLNHCRSRLGRRRLRTESLESETGERAIEDPCRGPEDLTLARDTGKVVGQALLHLPARFREAVVLRDIEGLTYAEISSVLSVRIGTVRSRIARGREQLRVLLEGAAP